MDNSIFLCYGHIYSVLSDYKCSFILWQTPVKLHGIHNRWIKSLFT
jgi:hypothetical protein